MKFKLIPDPTKESGFKLVVLPGFEEYSQASCFLCHNFIGIINDGEFEYVQCNFWGVTDLRVSLKMTAFVCPKDDKKRRENICN
jgi:hypothetical protein